MSPRPVRSRQDSQAFRPCVLCGQPTLMAELPSGQVVHLDVRLATYCVAWANEAAVPRAVESRAYAIHECQGACRARPRRVS